jgi:hypothetical protein
MPNASLPIGGCVYKERGALRTRLVADVANTPLVKLIGVVQVIIFGDSLKVG